MGQFGAPKEFLGDQDADAAGHLLAACADIALIIDASGVIRDIAMGSDDLASQGCAEWRGRPWASIVSVDSQAKVEGLLRDATTTAATRWRHLNHPLKSGPDLPLSYSAIRLQHRGKSAGAGEVIAFGRDLRPTATLQQRLVDAQQAMERDYWRFRQAEARYRHLFQVSGEGVLVVDATTQRVLEANPAAMQFFGERVRKLVGSSFPSGFDAASAARIEQLLAAVRAVGTAGPVVARLASSEADLDGLGHGLQELGVSVSLFRQDRVSLFLVRLARADHELAATPSQQANALLLKLAHGAADSLVVTDLVGKVLAANPAFVELAQLANEEQARGESLDRWIGRTGVDLSVIISNLRQHGAVRLFSTTLRGEFGASTEVEISATVLDEATTPLIGFSVRDVGRRLSPEQPSKDELPRSVGQLTELVGRVPLKDIVGETTDLIERLCIEAALELTRDNRASAAEMLGLSRQSLYVKLRRYGLGDLTAEVDKSA